MDYLAYTVNYTRNYAAHTRLYTCANHVLRNSSPLRSGKEMDQSCCGSLQKIHCGPTGSPTVVRQDLPLWSDRISRCGLTGSPTVVRQDFFLEDQFLSDQSACKFENTRGPVAVYIRSTVVYVHRVSAQCVLLQLWWSVLRQDRL